MLVINILRSVIATTLCVFFIVIFVLGFFLTVLSWKITSPDTIKSWIQQTGVYENPKAMLLEVLQERKGENPGLDQITQRIENPQDQLSIALDETIFMPGRLKYSVETSVNGVYEWAAGRTEKPLITLTLVRNAEEFTNLYSVLLYQRNISLPICESAPFERNPLFATCNVGFTIEEIREFMKKNENQEGLAQIQRIVTYENQPYEVTSETTENVQRWYLIAGLFPIFLFVIIVLLALILVVTIPVKNKRKVAAVIVLGLGILSFCISIISFVLSQNLHIFLDNIRISDIGESGQQLIRRIVSLILSDLLGFSTISSLLLAFMFIGLAFGTFLWLKRNRESIVRQTTTP